MTSGPVPTPATGAAPPARSLLARLASNRGVWALADQAVCSGGNFLTGVMIARTLDRHAYGEYWLLLGVVMFLNSLHGSVVTYPLTLGGAGAPLDRFRQLLRRAIGFTGVTGPVLAVVVLLAALRIGRPGLFPWVVAAMVLWQAQETCRRALIARLAYRWAIPGDAISFLGQAAGVWALASADALSAERAFGVIAATSGLAAVVQAGQILCTRVAAVPGQLETLPAEAAPGVAAEALQWWRTGRWLLLTCFVNVGTIYLPGWVLEAARGEAEVAMMGVMVAVMNLTNPVVFSISGLIVAAAAGARARAATPADGVRAARRVALKYAGMGMALVVPYYLVVLLFPAFVLAVFYKPTSPYVALAGWMPLVVLMYATLFASQMAMSLLNGLGEARGSFAATLAGSAAMACIAIPLIYAFGLRGSIVGGAVPLLAQLCVAVWMIRRVSRRATAGRPTPAPAGVAGPADADRGVGSAAA